MYTSLERVLVRAYGDEPACMLAHLSGNEVMIQRESGEVAIPYPQAFLYEWDAQLFQALTAAGSSEELQSLWQRARALALH